MTPIQKYNLLLILLATSLNCLAQQIELEGNYQAQDIFIKNPLSKTNKSWCIDSIWLNKTCIEFDKNDVFQIPFDSFNLKIGEALKIIIYHKSDCQPEVLHDSHTINKRVVFSHLSIDTTGLMQWEAKSTESDITFIIEQFRWNKCVEIGKLEAKKTFDLVNYQYQVKFHSGLNKFRLKSIDKFGKISYSKSVSINLNKPAITFKKSKNMVSFSAKTLIEIYDKQGKLISKNESNLIDTSSLPKGVYYISFDNRTEKIKVK